MQTTRSTSAAGRRFHRARLALTAVGSVLAGAALAAGAATPVTAAGRPSTADRPSTAVRASTTAVKSMNVMSFNICGVHCHDGSVPAVSKYVARVAKRSNASVVMLQEVCQDQFSKIKSLLTGYSGVFKAATHAKGCGAHRGFGVALLSRTRLTGVQVTPLPVLGGNEPRALLSAWTHVGGKSVYVAAVHLSPSARAGRDVQLAVLARKFAKLAGRRMIIGGDFNALPDTPGLGGIYNSTAQGTGRYLEADEFSTGTARRDGRGTFDTAGRKIDYIFFAEKWFRNPSAVSIDTTVSDHKVYLGKAAFTG